MALVVAAAVGELIILAPLQAAAQAAVAVVCAKPYFQKPISVLVSL